MLDFTASYARCIFPSHCRIAVGESKFNTKAWACTTFSLSVEISAKPGVGFAELSADVVNL
jgi:hypothetical protein